VNNNLGIIKELQGRFPGVTFISQATADGIPTAWVQRDEVGAVLRYLKNDADRPYRMLYDLTAIDERVRTNRVRQPVPSSFT
jgi:NADH-quinone oxidoreductase subunit C/D